MKSADVRHLTVGLFATSLIVAIASSAAAQQETLRSDLLGCYRLALSQWTPAAPSIPRLQIPPDTFELLAEPQPGWKLEGWPIVRPLLSPDDQMSSAGWRSTHPDSITAIFSNGFVGVTLRLQVAGDSMHGVADSFTDVVIVEGPPHPKARVVARRIPCAR